MDTTWIIKGPNNKITPFETAVQNCSRQELLPKGIKRMLKYWGIALLCILIPGLHFILVPAFFFLGIYLGFQTLKLNYKIIEGSFNCPECQKANALRDLWFKESIEPICQECGVQVTLTRS